MKIASRAIKISCIPGLDRPRFGNTFWWTVGFTALAFIPALLLPSANAAAPAALRPAAAEA